MEFKILRSEGCIFPALVYDQLEFLNLKSYTETTVGETLGASTKIFKVPANAL